MFPIADDHDWLPYKPVFTWLFIFINIAVFLYQTTLNEIALNDFIMQYGAVPSIITSWQNLVSLFTSMFLHGGWMHLIGNMLFLYVFGDNIEARLGSMKFLLFYICWWLAAHALQIIFTGADSTIPSIGASWCIAAVLGAYLVLFPSAQIRMFDIRSMSVYPVWASQFLLYWIMLQFLSGTWSLMSASEWWGWVGYRAHIGWFVFGRIAGKLKGRV